MISNCASASYTPDASLREYSLATRVPCQTREVAATSPCAVWFCNSAIKLWCACPGLAPYSKIKCGMVSDSAEVKPKEYMALITNNSKIAVNENNPSKT